MIIYSQVIKQINQYNNTLKKPTIKNLCAFEINNVLCSNNNELNTQNIFIYS